MCESAPVALALWRDVQTFESGLTYLGICGDFAHSQRPSGHNCNSAPGGNEDPINGVDYDPRYCHALDIGHGGDRDKAVRIRTVLLRDPRVRYVIDNGTGYYPLSRGGGTFTSVGHETHLHVSFMPGTHARILPSFFGPPPPPPIHWPLNGRDHGFVVMVLEIHLVHSGFENVHVDGGFGPQTLNAAQEMQRFLKRGAKRHVTRNDFQAIGDWARFTHDHPGRVLTVSDRGPQVRELRANLRKIGQDVDPTGVYDAEVQAAMTNIQRFFDLEHKAGNASRSDRRFVKSLADRA